MKDLFLHPLVYYPHACKPPSLPSVPIPCWMGTQGLGPSSVTSYLHWQETGSKVKAADKSSRTLTRHCDGGCILITSCGTMSASAFHFLTTCYLRSREREREDTFICWFTAQIPPVTPGWGHGQELDPCFSHGWEEPST